MDKPTSHCDWATGDPDYAVEPSAPKKATGFVEEEKPPFEYMNWALQNLGQWARIFDGAFKDFALVGSDSSYAQYADINAATEASKNKIILLTDINVTSEQNFSLSNGIIIFNKFKIIGTSAIAGSILLVSGSDNSLDNPHVQGTHTSGTTTDGIKFSGNRNHIRGHARAEQNGAGGTMTNGLNATGNNNQGDGLTRAIAGTLTNGKVDSGTDNDLRIMEV